MNQRKKESEGGLTPKQWAAIAGAVLVAVLAFAMLRPGGSTETGLTPGASGAGHPGAASVENNDSEATHGDPHATAEPDLPGDLESSSSSDNSDSDSSDD